MRIRPHNQATKGSNHNKQNNIKPKTRQNARQKNIKENVPPNLSQQYKDDEKRSENKNLKIKEELIGTIEGEYQKEILIYLKSIETSFQIEPSYLRNHHYISHQTRSIFVKYFFDVSRKFKLKRKTLFLAVYYMDSYFSKCLQLQKKQAKTSAKACLLMAMKYSQIYPPDLCQWTNPTKEIIQAQREILQKLDFNLSYTSIEDYLQFHFSKFQVDDQQRQIIRLIADVSTFDDSMYSFSPSQLSLYILLSICQPSRLNQQIGKSLKWMLERNESYLELLQSFQMQRKISSGAI